MKGSAKKIQSQCAVNSRVFFGHREKRARERQNRDEISRYKIRATNTTQRRGQEGAIPGFGRTERGRKGGEWRKVEHGPLSLRTLSALKTGIRDGGTPCLSILLFLSPHVSHRDSDIDTNCSCQHRCLCLAEAPSFSAFPPASSPVCVIGSGITSSSSNALLPPSNTSTLSRFEPLRQS